MQALYIGVSIATFIAILAVLVLRRRRIYRISALTMLGMTIAVLGGLFYGNSRWIGGSLMGIGVIATIVDAKYLRSHKHS
jgi:hypothetical protein